jgi:hypothetical protein
MGCSGFLEKPWGFKDDRIVRELLDGVSNEFDKSIRGQLDPRTTNPVDRGVLEGGLPFQQGRWRIGGPEGRICEGVFQGPAKPEGRILD